MLRPVIAAKLSIPELRADLVNRPRLIAKLDAGLRCALTLLSAPAGSGKTTLLAQWLHVSQRRCAWVSLDKSDNDPARFWSDVIAALETLDNGICVNTRRTLASAPSPTLDDLVTAVLNDVAAYASPFTLALEDYHVIAAEAVHDSLALLLAHMPRQMHLALSTRHDPPLPLPRLRAQGLLCEIRAIDLFFSLDETVCYLNDMMKLGLSAEDIMILHERTEGWTAALRLAAMTLASRADRREFVRSFGGDDRHVADFLFSEVLQMQPESTRQFLLRTSILSRLCGPLCDAVTGQSGSQATLVALEKDNLFILPMDHRRQWYRYHSLFADRLQSRLYETRAQEIPALHTRASVWCEREGYIAEAVSHSLAARDLTRAADLIEKHGLDMLFRSESALVYGWMRELPESLIQARPLLCVVDAWATLLSQAGVSAEEIELKLQQAELALAASQSPEERAAAAAKLTEASDLAELIAGHTATLRAFLARMRGGDPRQVINLSAHVFGRLPHNRPRLRGALALNVGLSHAMLGDWEAANHAFAEVQRIGNTAEQPLVALTALHRQAAAALERGRLHQAASICEDALRSIVDPAEERGGPVPLAGAIYIALGSVLVEWNQLEEAARTLDEGLELIRLTGERAVEVEGWAALARTRDAQGDADRARNALIRMEQLGSPQVAPLPPSLWLARLLARARPGAADDSRIVGAPHWASGSSPLDAAQLTALLALIARRRMEADERPTAEMGAVIGFLERQAAQALSEDRLGSAVQMLVLQAMARQANGLDAVACAQRALALARPEGYIRTFVEEGPPMARLLYECAAREPQDYINAILAAFPGVPQGVAPPSPLQAQPVETLSQREIEVLRLIGEGLTNAEIAQKLSLSPKTVKAHAYNIYGKLGAHNRTQAVARARAFGILPYSSLGLE